MACGWNDGLRRLEPMWCDAWSTKRTNTKRRADVLSHPCRARCTLCSCACWCRSCHCCPHWLWRNCCRHIVLRSHFCRDFLYQEIYSLHLFNNGAIPSISTCSEILGLIHASDIKPGKCAGGALNFALSSLSASNGGGGATRVFRTKPGGTFLGNTDSGLLATCYQPRSIPFQWHNTNCHHRCPESTYIVTLLNVVLANDFCSRLVYHRNLTLFDKSFSTNSIDHYYFQRLRVFFVATLNQNLR